MANSPFTNMKALSHISERDVGESNARYNIFSAAKEVAVSLPRMVRRHSPLNYIRPTKHALSQITKHV